MVAALALLLLALVVGIGGFVAWAAWQANQQQAERRRHWARTAQERAPARPRPRTELDFSLDHIEQQLDRLYSERARLQRLRDKGHLLRGRMQRSANLRPRLPQLDRVLERLATRARRLDELIGRYGQRREDLVILREGETFAAELEAFESSSDTQEPTERMCSTTEDLDDEAQRLMDIAEAEEELNRLLSA